MQKLEFYLKFKKLMAENTPNKRKNKENDEEGYLSDSNEGRNAKK